MVLHIIRVIFVLVVLGIAISSALTSEVRGTPDAGEKVMVTRMAMVMIIPVILAVVLILVDMGFHHKSLSSISGLFFGVVAGVFFAYILGMIVDLAALVFVANYEDVGLVIMAKLFVGACAIYLCVSFVMQTKDDFRFIIPYVEFSRQSKGSHPLLLDTSAIIDGRIADIAETRILEGILVVPRFVVEETQNIADSSDKLRRSRGRRGLDMLNKLQSNDKIEVQLHDARVPAVEDASEVDHKLVALAEHMDGKIVTNDYNLNKVAQLRGVDVININDLANALKPVVLPGEAITVKIIKPGEESGQGIGYLDDGTMVVVEQGRNHIGEDLAVVVTSTLQTSAGRMIFGKAGGQNNANSA
ncbi:MAG: TRAM domain-containing protein, partial [Phycisphaerae bacterium]|nr:TRAM domain-containing protein [Phycisphaerae bacterium]